MRVDPRLEQFTALIEQQRSRQPAIARSTQANRTLTSQSLQPAKATQPRENSPAFNDVAERARAAMAARNPTLAAKLEQARTAQANQSVQRTTATTRTASVQASTQNGRASRPGPVPATHDLLAIPKRPAPAPGLGTTIDTYA